MSQLCLLSESKVLIAKAKGQLSHVSNKDSHKVSWTREWNGWLIILFKDNNGLKLSHEQIQADARRLKHTHTHKNCHAQIWVDIGTQKFQLLCELPLKSAMCLRMFLMAVEFKLKIPENFHNCSAFSRLPVWGWNIEFYQQSHLIEYSTP